MLETASWPHRVLALVIDWAASTAVAIGLIGLEAYATAGWAGWVPLAVYLVEASVGTALVGGSLGQLLTRIRVRRTDGRTPDLLRALGRTLLICLVVPPLVFRPDGRGLHDLWTDSGAYRLLPSRPR